MENARPRLPGSLVAVIVLDGILALPIAMYAILFAMTWSELDLFLRLELAGQVTLILAFAASVAGIVHRRSWARPLNVVAALAPVAFFLAVAATAVANLAGLGQADVTAGLGLVYSVIAILSFAPFVVATVALLAVGPGVRDWLRIPPRVPPSPRQDADLSA